MPLYLTKKQKIALVLALTMTIEHNKRKKKRLWSKQQLLKEEQISYMNSIRELDNQEFRSCLRMDQYSFDLLLNLVRPLITKQDTIMRQAVSAEERLLVTLKYLALGKDYSDLGYSSGISVQSVCKIVPETCEAICKVLKNYIQIPKTQNEWLKVAKEYQEKWQFPHCVGAVGARHILIIKPKQRPSHYYNYKGSFSVVLFAVVNADHEFLYVHMGTKGSLSDGPILKCTKFNEKLTEGQLNLPQDSNLPKTKLVAPYVFIGDNGFGMDRYILEPYPHEYITGEMKIFNYRFSRAKRVEENVFGILSSRFRVFQKHILVDIQNVDKIIMAGCVLHNFLKRHSANYFTNDCIDCEDIENVKLQPGQWRERNPLVSLQKCDQESGDDPIVKGLFSNYFNGPGSVNFQNKMLNVVMSCHTE